MCHLYHPWVCKISEQGRRTTTLGTLKELVAQDLEPEDVPHVEGKHKLAARTVNYRAALRLEPSHH